jgi:hypothetical protein
MYQAQRDTAKEPGASPDWACLAAAGRDGRTFKVRGTYATGKDYSAFDIVACNNGTFVALKDGAGDCPGPDWQLIAGPGKRGDKGAPGDRGPPGEPVQIVGWKHGKDFTVIPVLGDGGEGPVLSLRKLFEEYGRQHD